MEEEGGENGPEVEGGGGGEEGYEDGVDEGGEEARPAEISAVGLGAGEEGKGVGEIGVESQRGEAVVRGGGKGGSFAHQREHTASSRRGGEIAGMDGGAADEGVGTIDSIVFDFRPVR